jgi:hypothetical protein
MELLVIPAVALNGWLFARYVLGHLGPHVIEPWRVRRRHDRVTIRSIGELRENEIGRMIGRVAALEGSLTAPLSGRRCVYYAVVVEQHLRNGSWRECFTAREGVAFALADRTGRAIIHPGNARTALAFDHAARVRWRDDLTLEQSTLLARHSFQREGWGFNKTLRFHESVIQVDAAISVVGAGIREPAPSPPGMSGYRDPLPTQLHVSNSAAAPLSICSVPG